MKPFSIAALALAAALILASCSDSPPAPSAQAAPADAGANANATTEAASWLTDFDQARALAAQSERLILVNFTGSDWCPPCAQLKKDILTTEAFADYASEHLVLLELDFPRHSPQPEALQRQNRQLAEQYQVSGFPTLALLDSEGTALAQSVGYLRGGPNAFIQWSEAARKRLK